MNKNQKCDGCDRLARWSISGYYAAHFLCSFHAATLCESVGDIAGRDKFNAYAQAEAVTA